MIRTACFPFNSRGNPRAFSRSSLQQWALSVSLSARWFVEIRLIADPLSSDILDVLQLPFTQHWPLEVPARLDFMPLFGKHQAHALCAQEGTPYLMIDYDLFLWRKLDDELLSAPGLVQVREETNAPVNRVLNALALLNPGVTIPRYPFACNAGLSGGNDIETLRAWTTLGCALANDPRNEPALRLGNGWVPASAFDESLLMAFFGDRMRFAVEQLDKQNDDRKFERAGLTHLAGPLKHEPLRQLQVETRLGLMFPESYERVQRVWFDDVATR